MAFMIQNTTAPIIIIGMHRSGTTMITTMLENLGVFVGVNNDKNNEPLFFIKLNDWILRQAGGTWDHPKVMQDLINDHEISDLVADYMHHHIKSIHIRSYLGVKNILLGKVGNIYKESWGWKDPRNTFTLPLWLKLFPEAKVIHVYRNGVDIAQSLSKRRSKIKKLSEKNHKKRDFLYKFFSKKSGFVDSIRCRDLNGGFSLWEEYMDEAIINCEKLGDQCISIKYEDFLAEPIQNLKKITEHCNLNVTDRQLISCSESIDKSRANAFKNDDALNAFSSSMSERLEKYGYK